MENLAQMIGYPVRSICFPKMHIIDGSPRFRRVLILGVLRTGLGDQDVEELIVALVLQLGHAAHKVDVGVVRQDNFGLDWKIDPLAGVISVSDMAEFGLYFVHTSAAVDIAQVGIVDHQHEQEICHSFAHLIKGCLVRDGRLPWP